MGHDSEAPKIHPMYVFGQTHAAIACGEKTHEVRIAYPEYQKIVVGDILDFGGNLKKRVVLVEHFETIESCIQTLGVNALLPGFTSDQAVCVWSTREDVQKNLDGFDIVAFCLE